MPTTSRSPEWNPTLNQAVAKSDCGREGWRPGDWTSLGRSSETTALSQKVYNNGFKCELTKTLDDGSVDILVPKGANTFTVMGGQSDNSRNTNVTVTFEVINPLSNEVLDSASLPLGQAKEFRIDVSGIPRLTLKVLAEASAGESTKNAINVQPVWADPKFS
jgi:NPCBM/NEW2 domain